MYEEAIVTYLDILGFKELVNSKDAAEINNILSLFEDFSKPETKDDLPFLPETFSFSDLIVRVRRTKTEGNIKYRIGIFFHELIDLLHAQGDLVNKGILLRGGVAFGKIFLSGTKLFGPALIDAYELESKYAQYPRIVVSPKLIQELKINELLRSDHHDLDEELKYIKALLRQSDDGIWFIDYLKAIEGEMDNEALYPEYIINHRQLIVKNASKFNYLNKVLAKYIWLANYHNQIISGLSQEWFDAYNLEPATLLIDSNELPSLQYI